MIDITNLVRVSKISASFVHLSTVIPFFLLISTTFYGLWKLGLTLIDSTSTFKLWVVPVYMVLIVAPMLLVVKSMQLFQTKLLPMALIFSVVPIMVIGVWYKETVGLLPEHALTSIGAGIVLLFVFSAVAVTPLLPFQSDQYLSRKPIVGVRSALYAALSFDPLKSRNLLILAVTLIGVASIPYLITQYLIIAHIVGLQIAGFDLLDSEYRFQYGIAIATSLITVASLVTGHWTTPTALALALCTVFMAIDVGSLQYYDLASMHFTGDLLRGLIMVTVIVIAVTLVSIELLAFAFRFLRRFINQDSVDIVAKLGTEPGLFLRAFRDDEQCVQVPWVSLRRLLLGLHSTRIESIAATELAWRRPMIALANPHSLSKPAGAFRHQLESDDWREDVIRLLDQCQVICVCLGVTENLRWEMETILSSVNYRKLVLVVPLGFFKEFSLHDLSEDLSRQMGFSSRQDELEVLAQCRAVTFDPITSSFVAITSRSADMIAYREALRIAFDVQQGRHTA